MGAVSGTADITAAVSGVVDITENISGAGDITENVSRAGDITENVSGVVDNTDAVSEAVDLAVSASAFTGPEDTDDDKNQLYRLMQRLRADARVAELRRDEEASRWRAELASGYGSQIQALLCGVELDENTVATLTRFRSSLTTEYEQALVDLDAIHQAALQHQRQQHLWQVEELTRRLNTLSAAQKNSRPSEIDIADGGVHNDSIGPLLQEEQLHLLHKERDELSCQLDCVRALARALGVYYSAAEQKLRPHACRAGGCTQSCQIDKISGSDTEDFDDWVLQCLAPDTDPAPLWLSHGANGVDRALEQVQCAIRRLHNGAVSSIALNSSSISCQTADRSQMLLSSAVVTDGSHSEDGGEKRDEVDGEQLLTLLQSEFSRLAGSFRHLQQQHYTCTSMTDQQSDVTLHFPVQEANSTTVDTWHHLRSKANNLLLSPRPSGELFGRCCKLETLLLQLTEFCELTLQHTARYSDDLRKQMESADKQLRREREYLDDVAAERENERDEFARELERLHLHLTAVQRDRDDKLARCRDLEFNEIADRDISSVLADTECERDKCQQELRAAVDKIGDLRDVIRTLECRLDSVSAELVEVLSTNQEQSDTIGILRTELFQCSRAAVSDGSVPATTAVTDGGVDRCNVGKGADPATWLSDSRESQLSVSDSVCPSLMDEMYRQFLEMGCVLDKSMQISVSVKSGSGGDTQQYMRRCTGSDSGMSGGESRTDMSEFSSSSPLPPHASSLSGGVVSGDNPVPVTDTLLHLSVLSSKLSKLFVERRRDANKLEELHTRNHVLVAQIQDMSAERDISQAQLGDQLIELSSLRAELQQSRIAADLRTSDGTKYQQQLDQLLQSVQRLKQQVSDAELEVKTSQNQCEELRCQLSSSQAEVKRLLTASSVGFHDSQLLQHKYQTLQHRHQQLLARLRKELASRCQTNLISTGSTFQSVSDESIDGCVNKSPVTSTFQSTAVRSNVFPRCQNLTAENGENISSSLPAPHLDCDLQSSESAGSGEVSAEIMRLSLSRTYQPTIHSTSTLLSPQAPPLSQIHDKQKVACVEHPLQLLVGVEHSLQLSGGVESTPQLPGGVEPLQLSRGVEPPLQLSAGVEPHLQLSGSVEPHLQLSAGVEPHLQLSGGVESTPQLPGGVEPLQLSRGVEPPLQLSAGVEPPLQLSGSVEPHLQLSAGVEPHLQLSAGVEPHLQLSAGVEPHLQLSAGGEPHLQLSAGVEPHLQLSGGVESTPQLPGGVEPLQLSRGVEPPLQLSAGVEPPLQLSGSVEPHLQLSAGVEPHLQLSAGVEPHLQLSAGVEPHLQLSAGGEPHLQLSAGVEPHLQLSAGVEPHLQLSAGVEPHLQLSAGVEPHLQLSAGVEPHLQLSAGVEPHLQLSAGVEPPLQLSVGIEPTLRLSADLEYPIESSTGVGPPSLLHSIGDITGRCVGFNAVLQHSNASESQSRGSKIGGDSKQFSSENVLSDWSNRLVFLRDISSFLQSLLKIDRNAENHERQDQQSDVNIQFDGELDELSSRCEHLEIVYQSLLTSGQSSKYGRLHRCLSDLVSARFSLCTLLYRVWAQKQEQRQYMSHQCSLLARLWQGNKIRVRRLNHLLVYVINQLRRRSSAVEVRCKHLSDQSRHFDRCLEQLSCRLSSLLSSFSYVDHPVDVPHHPAGASHHPVDAPHHPAGAPHHPAGASHQPVDAPHHPVGASQQPVDAPHHPAGASHQPVDAPLHPSGASHRSKSSAYESAFQHFASEIGIKTSLLEHGDRQTASDINGSLDSEVGSVDANIAEMHLLSRIRLLVEKLHSEGLQILDLSHLRKMVNSLSDEPSPATAMIVPNNLQHCSLDNFSAVTSTDTSTVDTTSSIGVTMASTCGTITPTVGRMCAEAVNTAVGFSADRRFLDSNQYRKLLAQVESLNQQLGNERRLVASLQSCLRNQHRRQLLQLKQLRTPVGGSPTSSGTNQRHDGVESFSDGLSGDRHGDDNLRQFLETADGWNLADLWQLTSTTAVDTDRSDSNLAGDIATARLKQLKQEIDLSVSPASAVSPQSNCHHRYWALAAKYLRSESYRRALCWQKRYLVVASAWRGSTVLSSSVLRKYVFVVMAIWRMRFLVKRWRNVVR